MTKGQKLGFGLGIGVLVIGMTIVSYLLWKEKKAKGELKEMIAPTPPAPSQIAAASLATEIAVEAAAARSAQKFSA